MDQISIIISKVLLLNILTTILCTIILLIFTNKHPERYVPLGTYMNGCILNFF